MEVHSQQHQQTTPLALANGQLRRSDLSAVAPLMRLLRPDFHAPHDDPCSAAI